MFQTLSSRIWFWELPLSHGSLGKNEEQRSIPYSLIESIDLMVYFRTVKGMDVPSTVLKSAPDICNIFLVSRWKLVFKLATKAFHFGTNY